jgi:hypothetical protein
VETGEDGFDLDDDLDGDLDGDLENEPSPEDFEEGSDDPRPPVTLKRMSKGGQLIGAAMIGLAEVLEPRPKVEVPIEIATPGEPPNIDTNGLDEDIAGGSNRMVGPPLDRIKSKQRVGRTTKRRREPNV